MRVPGIMAWGFLFLSFLVWAGTALGQTYTTSGLSTNWNDPTAWVKTNPELCATPNTSNFPPLGPVYASCDIRIVINHPISRPGNASIGGGNVRSITVNQGGEVSFGGNVTVNNVGAPTFLFQINDGGRFIVVGTLGIQAGTTFNMVNTSIVDPKTFVQVNNLTFLNSGSGQAVNVGSNTVFNVISQTRLEGGGALNIQGEYITNTFNSANSGGSQVNVSGNGLLRTTGNMLIQGYPMSLSGNAGVVVGGNLTITNSGNSSLNLNGPNTNFTVLNTGSNIASGKTPFGTCFQTPENGNNCYNSACLETLTILISGTQFERVYIFKCSAYWTVPSDSTNIANGDSLEIIDSFRALTVAGGGGGGRGASAGGGGGGGIVYEDDLHLNSGSQLSITVGKGGLGSTNSNVKGSNGQNSQIQGFVTAIGGGGGGSTNNGVRSGSNGGSGGGGALSGGNLGGNGTTGQGNSGGDGSNNGSNNKGGGGGGSGSNGFVPPNGNQPGGNGGSGLSFSISVSTTFYSGGGGGLGIGGGGSGGSEIGGTGNGSGNLRNGIINTGSGGGATSSGLGGNGGSGVIIIRSIVLRVLPVEFLYFNAKYNPTLRSGDLSWSTAKEWDNTHFEIERSINNVQDWETIGYIRGAGYSEQPVEYVYQDMNLPPAGGDIFYRLKQFDFDGDSTYSITRAIRIDPMAGTSFWRVYPNPSTGDPINLEMIDKGAYRDEEITVRIISVTGQFDVIENQSPTRLSAQLSTIFKSRASGIYTLEISWGNQREYHKVILRR